jgi:diguanylate cyclase (GGDEF)-like protein
VAGAVHVEAEVVALGDHVVQVAHVVLVQQPEVEHALGQYLHRGVVWVHEAVARLGGDEFILLLPETGAESATAVATKIHASLKETVEQRWPVTFSIGMVTYHEAPASIDEMIRIADQLMYEVKNSSKDELRHLVIS